MIGIEYKRTAGLGNKLFPFALAVVAAKSVGLPIVDPLWFSPRGAGITRGGIDRSAFLGKIELFRNFRRIPNSRSFVNQFRMQKRVRVSDLEEFYFLFERYDSTVFYEFAWDAAHNFADLIIHRDFKKQELFQIARARLPELEHEKRREEERERYNKYLEQIRKEENERRKRQQKEREIVARAEAVHWSKLYRIRNNSLEC